MSYVNDQLQELIRSNPNQPEFIQAATEVLKSLEPVVEKNQIVMKRSVHEQTQQ